MRWRIAACLLATAVVSCANAQHPAEPPAPHSLAAAIPPEAKIAFLLPTPWAKSATHREVAARLGLVKQYAAAMLVVRGTLGFDPTDPAAVRAHGFDDQAGIGLFVPAADSTPIFVAGVANAQRVHDTLRRIFDGIEERETGGKLVFDTRAVSSGDGVTVARRTHGEVRAAYLIHGGFLYLRLAGDRDPVPELGRVTAVQPGGGLERNPNYRALAPRVAAADAVLYLADLPSKPTSLPGIRFTGGAAVTLDVQADRLSLQVHGRREPGPDTAEPKPIPPPRVDLAAGLPADATLWMHLSCSPELLWHQLTNTVPDWRRLAENLQAMFGEDADHEIRSSFTGNFAVGIYPSAAKLRGRPPGTSQDAPAFLLVAELAAGRENDVEAALDRGAENRSRKTPMAVQRRVASGMPIWRIGGETIVALHGQRLVAMLPTRPSASAAGEPEAPGKPRWPPEATASELGAFSELLRPGHNPLRDELRKLHVDDDAPGPAHPVFRATGAIFDFPRLLGALRADGPAPLAALNEFLRHPSPAFHNARFEWDLGRDALDAELRWTLPEKAPDAPPPVAGEKRSLADSLRAMRRSTEEHPEVLAFHDQLASLLLQAMAGKPARTEASRTVARPNPGGLLLVARILEHDPYGRPWHTGLDAEGAERALRLAQAMAPKRYDARVGLALLLEHDRGGQRDFSEARLSQAAEEIRTIRDAWSRGDLDGRPDGRLLDAEFFAGLFTEVLADAPRVAPSESRDTYAVAARAASQGADAAIKDSERIGDPAARAKTMKNAIGFLEIARRYSEAAALGRAAASVIPDGREFSRRAEQDSKVSRVDPPRQQSSNPAALVEEAAIAAYDPRVTAAELFPFLATDSPISKEAVRAALLAITTGRRAELLAIGAGVANIRDYFHWLSDFRVEGDRETGWRVEVHSNSVTDLWWLVYDEGGPKVFCRKWCTAPLGGRALALAEAGKPEVARRILDWARDALPKDESRRDGHETLFVSVWNGDPARVRVAAAVAAADGAQGARAIPVLDGAMESSDQPLRDRLKAALGFAKLGLKDAEGALQSIEGADPASAPQVKDVRIVALLRLKRFAEAERDIDEWLLRAPDDPFALSYAMRHGELVDDLARIEKPARKLIASKQHLVGEAANELAWAKFCHRQFDEDAIQLAEITSKSGSAEGLNTLATLYAETGRLDEARKTLLKSIDANDAYTDDGQIGFADQYALARVWEGYGLNDLAATEYGKLSVTDDDAPPARRCIAAAARRRLAGLRKVQ